MKNQSGTPKIIFIQLAILLSFIFFIGCNPKVKETNQVELIQQVKFEYIKVDTAGPADPWAKIFGDLDKDGLNDIIIGGRKKPLVWYKYPDWTKHIIVDGGYDTVDGEAADIDGDGDLDIVMGGLFWYENPGDLTSDPDQTWTSHLVADHPTHDIEIADLNMDGRLDIVSRNQSEFGYKAGNTIHLWINTGTQTWEESVLKSPHGEGILVSDIDNDGDIDIVTGGIWYENTLQDNKVGWLEHTFAKFHPNANVEVADFNADGRPDIVLTPSELAGSNYKLSWFEAPVNPSESNWTEHVLVDPIETVIHSIAVGDVNNDGSIDIVYAEMHQGADPDEVVVLYNPKNGLTWEKQVISDKGSHGIQVADINNDGKLDIFGANWSSEYQPIELWIGK